MMTCAQAIARGMLAGVLLGSLAVVGVGAPIHDVATCEYSLVIGAMIKLVPIADRRGTDKYGCALTAVDFGGLESYPDRAPAARRHLEGARCNPT